MTAFMVFWQDWDGCEPRGFYTTRELAEKALANLVAKDAGMYTEYYDIEEIEIKESA